MTYSMTQLAKPSHTHTCDRCHGEFPCWEKDFRRSGLHGFRHANSSLMDRLSTPVKVRQERLGHSDPRITINTYTHSVGQDDRRIAAQLGKILHPDAPKSVEECVSLVEELRLVQ